MAITAGGIGSGLDIDGLVRQLVAAERQPVSLRLDRKEASLLGNLSAYGTLKSALSTFQTAVKGLQNPDTFQARRTSSSNTDLFTGTSTKDAVAGTYSINVQQLAQAAKMRSDAFDPSENIGTGSMTLSLGSDSFTLDIDSENNTLEGIRDAINAASNNPGITASIISAGPGDSRLVLTSNRVGEGNDISITATDDDVPGGGLERFNSLNTVQAAQDAIVFVDGLEVRRDSNTVSDVIQGVTLNLRKADENVTGTLTVTLDTASVKTRVETFVSAYNELVGVMNQLSAFNADTGDAGPLLGDSALRGVQSQIRQALSGSVGDGTFSTLAEIGVTTNSSGQLTINNTRLDEVIAQDFSAIANLFASENGLTKTLDGILDRYVASDGILSSRTNGIQSRIGQIDNERERLDTRMEALESRYRAQFTAMDILVGQLQGLSGYLEQQLSNLPQPNSIGRRR
ncbi:flagellar hook-associated 2 domain-containing protein [Methylophaga lonarensis MPL]|uniref:Flagellar hook-associated protein 2 n=1 Tax=Methylophaga lonarensis MPL TaxID=1286106 RepID=M7P470_9GAMM|nr:flagellar filament capping protein FliD [Methylophaga lonarensis]EMR14286.1 flagellar hook-associated 2 domain-containing protein [Methylophaga lonarensis MPL]